MQTVHKPHKHFCPKLSSSFIPIYYKTHLKKESSKYFHTSKNLKLSTRFATLSSFSLYHENINSVSSLFIPNRRIDLGFGFGTMERLYFRDCKSSLPLKAYVCDT